MKRSIILTVLISLLIPFAGLSQKTDTVCIPIVNAKRILAKVEQGKADSATLVLRNAEVSELRQIMASNDITVSNLNLRVSAQDMLVQSLNTQITQLNKSLRKQKAKTTLAIIGGILTSGGLAYLLLK